MNLFDVLFAKKLSGGGSPFPPVIKRVTGNPIEFSDGADAPLVKCVTQITGYQEGSGTPSPENVRPIVTYTEGEIEVSDGGGNTTTHTTTYPYAIYRGSEDCVNGEVTSEMPVIDLGDLSWSAYTTDTTGHSFYVNVPTGVKSVSSDSSVANMVCENYETVAFINPSEWLRRNAIICQVPNAQRWIVRDERYSDATAFTTAMNGVQLAYELATPTTSSVTPTNLPIKSLSGYNHIESSTGEMEVDYITEGYQNFVDTTERAVPSTRKGGVKAFDIFKTLDEPKTPEAPAEGEPEEKETEEGAKK